MLLKSFFILLYAESLRSHADSVLAYEDKTPRRDIFKKKIYGQIFLSAAPLNRFLAKTVKLNKF